MKNEQSLEAVHTHTHTHGYSLKNNRIQSFDIARTFAILCVVLCHSVESAYNINYMHLSETSQIFRIIFFTIGRLGVPIFLFLTGALTLKKQIETDEDIKKFYIKNLIPLFITIEIWNVLYNIFFISKGQQFNMENFLKEILFLKQVNMPNMWYMPMILGMYIAIPFVAKIVKTFTLKTIKIPLIIVSITSILLPSLNVLFKIIGLEQYKIIIDVSFFGGCYGLYILLGYYLNNGLLKKWNKMSLIISIIVNFSITCIIQYISYKNQIKYDVWYNFFTLFLCSICIFELFTRIKNKTSDTLMIKITQYISKISLGIFFLHEVCLKIFVIYTSKMNLKNPIETILLFIVTTLISTIFIYYTSKIKVIKERIFLIKD